MTQDWDDKPTTKGCNQILESIGSWNHLAIGSLARVHLDDDYVMCMVVGEGTLEEYEQEYQDFGVGESEARRKGAEGAYFYKVTAE